MRGPFRRGAVCLLSVHFLYDLEHDESQPASANVILILLGMELKTFTYLDIIMTFTICYILTFVDDMR